MPNGEEMSSVLIKKHIIFYKGKLFTYLFTGKYYANCLQYSALYFQHRARISHRRITKVSKEPLPPLGHLKDYLVLNK